MPLSHCKAQLGFDWSLALRGGLQVVKDLHANQQYTVRKVFFFVYLCSYKVEDCILSIGFNSDVFPNMRTRRLPRVADLGSSKIKMWGEISFLVNNFVYFIA